MPKRKFPKFAKFPKVSKMKVFAETVKCQKSNAFDRFNFSRNVSFEKVLKSVKNQNNFPKTVNFEIFLKNLSKIKTFLKKLSNFRTVIFMPRLHLFDPIDCKNPVGPITRLDSKTHIWTLILVIQNPKIL